MSARDFETLFSPPSTTQPHAAPSLQLPPPPETETGPVKAWQQPVIMRTWMPARPDPNPLFLEKRVYQGSSGRVYPLPVIDRIETEPVEHAWQAIHIQNEFIRLMVMPELGGRIHVGLDLVNDYDFFYRQNVIKPALVGLAGPWISGGVEFNWPQHHRPATYMAVETCIEREPDGSVVVWCSDHDPMARMKGMHGVCLRPGKAYVELRVRLHNRTSDTQTFLWWANVATRVHEHYQSFFPHDVEFAADHAKRAITEFPLSQSMYYGVDYPGRAAHGVPEGEQPRMFCPDGSYPPNDLSRYANIPVPTSYMIANSAQDFFGGYDHARQAGVVHVANHHIAPGKKQWTWGNQEFGYAWDRSLTENDGPYIELMAGVYTDNQPDFSFLAPGETKSFTQHWYPIRAIGIPDFANLDAALRLERTAQGVCVHLQTTAHFAQCVVRVRAEDRACAEWRGDLAPDQPLHFACDAHGNDMEVIVENQGRTLLRWAPDEVAKQSMPEAATEPPLPADVSSNDELYIIGMHLEQYRHPTRAPEPYWQEALRRDAGDSRAHLAMGRWHLRRGEFAQAEQHLRQSIARLTSRNPNPTDGEPYYQLGLTLSAMGREQDAYAAFYKATWGAAWRSPAFHRLAELDCKQRQWNAALEHLERSLAAETDNLGARNLQALVLRALGRTEEAEQCLRQTRALDPLDACGRFLLQGSIPEDAQQRLDLVFDLMCAGCYPQALALCTAPCNEQPNGGITLLLYARAEILRRMQRADESCKAFAEAAQASPEYVFPSRLEELLLLQQAIRENPADARAHFYLGNLLYDRKRHQEAIEHWQEAARLEPELATVWRNLGIACFNILHDAARAHAAFAQARRLAPSDARLLYEHDQLARRTGTPPAERLAELQAHPHLVALRDDLSVELATLLNNAGRPAEALDLLQHRIFQPWEGGEGMALAQFVRAQILLGKQALDHDHPTQALACFEAAFHPPRNLRETHHPLANTSLIDYWTGVACAQLGQPQRATEHWQRAAERVGDFQQMKVQAISEMTYWSAQVLRRLGREQQAVLLLEQIASYAAELEASTPSIDYFATSLPDLLLFEEDLKSRQNIQALFLKAQSAFGLGNTELSASWLAQLLALDNAHSGALDWPALQAVSC